MIRNTYYYIDLLEKFTKIDYNGMYNSEAMENIRDKGDVGNRKHHRWWFGLILREIYIYMFFSRTCSFIVDFV